MSRRDFIKAILKGDAEEAKRLRDALFFQESQAKIVIAEYLHSMPDKPSKEQEQRFNKFCNKTERENPNCNIIYIMVREPEFSE